MKFTTVLCCAAAAMALVGCVAASGSSHRLNRWHGTSPVSRALPMSGGVLTTGFYSVNVTIGTPPFLFEVLLDTGSATLSVPGAACKSCGNTNTVYDASKSTTSQPVACHSAKCDVCNPVAGQPCVFGQPYCAVDDASLCGAGISYGGGSSYISGHMVQDVVTFGGVSVNTSFVVQDNQYPAGSFSAAGGFNGILGLANELNNCNPTCDKTLFDVMVEDGGMANMFGMCLSEADGGVLDLGFADSSKYNAAAVQWVPMVQKRWYNIPLIDVQISTTSIGLPPFVYSYVNDAIASFTDSGTGIVLLGPEAFSSFQFTFQTKFASLPGVAGSSNIFDGACLTSAQLAEYPDLHFVFNGVGEDTVTLPMSPKKYFLPNGAGKFCLGVQGVPGIGGILGDTFMSQFYIVTDRANSKVGFAPLTGSCSLSK